MQVKKKQFRTGHGTMDWFQIGKGVWQGHILSPCLFKLHAAYIMWNAGLDEAQAGIKIAGRNINNLRYADNIIPMAESKEVLKSLFFFPFLQIYFNWRIITLQYCDGFCCTTRWIGHRYTCAPPPSWTPSLPNQSLWVLPEHWLWVPCFMHQTCTGHLFYIWYVQFQCYSLKSSHSHLLPLSPKVYYLHLSPLLPCM